MVLYVLFENKNTFLFLYFICLLFNPQMCQIILLDPVYKICKHVWLITFLNEAELIFSLYTNKWFYVFLSNSNNSMYNESFVYTHLNCSKYCYVSLTIHSNFSYLFTQLNNQIVVFQTIQYSINHLFALSLNVKQFYLINRTLSGNTVEYQ